MNDTNAKPDPQKEYRWSITESAPKEYVVQIISGHFEAADGYKKGTPTRSLVALGWGNGRSSIAEGREEMPLPTRFEVTWFSYREDTFYHANFDLPFERIQTLVEMDTRAQYTHAERFSKAFTLGLAPGGFITIWLTSGNHQWVVFEGMAEEVEGIPWKAVFENPEFPKAQIMDDVISDTLKDASGSSQLNDPGYWKRLHEEVYDYDIVIESEYTPYVVSASFLNRENHRYFSNSQAWRSAPLSMMKAINFAFFFPDELRTVKIQDVNTDLLYDAFRTLSKESNSPLRVVVSVDGSLLGWKYTTRIRVENDERAIEIPEYKFGRYGGSDRTEKIKESKELMRYMNYPGKPAQP